MPSSIFDPRASAQRLLEAWRSGKLLSALPGALKPETLEQGYAVQDQLFKAAGGLRAGWKLGVGSPAAMRAAALSRPLVGQLAADRLHAGGAHLQMPAISAVTVECEIAFVLARDLPPLVGRVVEAGDIQSTCVTFEIVRARFSDRKAVGSPSFAADNVGFEALIVGQTVCAGLDLAVLRELAVTTVVSLDGVAKARGLFDETATDPLNSLAGLYQHAAERGETLRAGDIVTTGAMCEAFDIQGAGHEVSARFFNQTLSFSL